MFSLSEHPCKRHFVALPCLILIIIWLYALMSLILTPVPWLWHTAPRPFNYISDAINIRDFEAIENRLLLNVRFFIRPNNSMLAYKLSSLAVLELRFPKVVNFEGIEAVLKRCSVKKLFLLISQNSQVFSCKFC